jgi:hypothetical protein
MSCLIAMEELVGPYTYQGHLIICSGGWEIKSLRLMQINF